MRGLSQGLVKVSPTLVKSASAAFLIPSDSVLLVARLLGLQGTSRRRKSQRQWDQTQRILRTAATAAMGRRTASHRPHRLQLLLITERPREEREFHTVPQWVG
ncbi:hypothetical protein GLYMA_08G271402v4 [Glycine max]|nr:hypothetical protein GLYMA_08G271402v4 [Glycine max]KAH1053315.1 hypothetical protein GYH30_022554 [Glycine max]